jgi:hypothetical protein
VTVLITVGRNRLVSLLDFMFIVIYFIIINQSFWGLWSGNGKLVRNRFVNAKGGRTQSHQEG